MHYLVYCPSIYCRDNVYSLLSYVHPYLYNRASFACIDEVLMLLDANKNAQYHTYRCVSNHSFPYLILIYIFIIRFYFYWSFAYFLIFHELISTKYLSICGGKRTSKTSTNMVQKKIVPHKLVPIDIMRQVIIEVILQYVLPLGA